MALWNVWHGCHKISPGCANCYVYRTDSKYGKDSSIVTKTGDFYLPLRRNRQKEYKIQPGETVYTCFTSDFFVEEGDLWRKEVWQMMYARKELYFFIITKRIDRFFDTIPENWKDGYENVHICCTVENQAMADYRLPIFLSAPIKHKSIVCEPLLEKINIAPYLKKGIKEVIAGGESGTAARLCDYDWVLDIRKQCIQKGVDFIFRQTGAKFKKEGRIYFIKRNNQLKQAKKANIDFRTK